MASTHKQRFRTSCRYFNFVCKPAGKYALECSKPWYRRCRDVTCKATQEEEPVRRRQGHQIHPEVV